MAGFGRLDAKITNSTNWTLSVNDGGGADTVTITAGSRYTLEFIAALETALEAATGSGWTVTIADGEGASGKVTLAINSGTVSLTWVTTALRDLLGFTGNSASAASHTGTNGMQSIWLPDCPIQGDDLHFSSTGNYEDDGTYNEGPTGKISVWLSSSKETFNNVRWTHVTDSRAISGVDSTLVCWQDWVVNTQKGGATPFSIGADGVPPLVKVYSNADSDTLLGAASGGDGIYRLILHRSLALPRPHADWYGLNTCTIPRMIKV